MCVWLAACADPLEQVPRLDDVALEPETTQVDALPEADAQEIDAADAPKVDTSEAPTGGLLGFFRRQAERSTQADAVETADEVETATADGEAAGLETAVKPDAEDAPQAAAQATDASEGTATDERPARRGLFGLFNSPPTQSADDEQTAALAPESDAPNAAPRPRNSAATPPRNRRQPRGRGPKPGAPDYRQVGPGATLPYGEIARLCGVSAAKLGKKTASYPERGRGYTIYDSAPGSTGLRNFYVTGFDDGCARQFTAALVVFGEVTTYEQIRYSAASKTQPVSATDVAYETVKSRVCRVPKGKPCGSRLPQLAKTTVFLSIYERFGSNPRWKNLLLHDGEVAALDVKG